MTTMTTPTPPSSAPTNPSSPHNQNGINIKDALSILSSRAKDGGDKVNATNSSSVPSELKEMGQTIDIMEQMEFANNNQQLMGCDCVTNGNGDIAAAEAAAAAPKMSKEDEMKHEAMKEERKRRTAEIRTQLQSMAVGDLLKMIFQAQEERVATYKIFEDGLSTILASGNMTNYPTLCAKVTASFSVLSDTINAVKSSLLENGRKRTDITSVIGQLQKLEGQKLNLTAALHLEKLRLRNASLNAELTMATSSSGVGEGEKGAGGDSSGGEVHDEQTMQLLKGGIQTLERQISKIIMDINEMLEELRCIAADEEE